MAKFLSASGVLVNVSSKKWVKMIFESNWNDVELDFGIIDEHVILFPGYSEDYTDGTSIVSKFTDDSGNYPAFSATAGEILPSITEVAVGEKITEVFSNKDNKDYEKYTSLADTPSAPESLDTKLTDTFRSSSDDFDTSKKEEESFWTVETSEPLYYQSILLGNKSIQYNDVPDIEENKLNAYNKFIDKSIINIVPFFGKISDTTFDVNLSFLQSGTSIVQNIHDFQQMGTFSVNVKPEFIDTNIVSYNIQEFFVEYTPQATNNFYFYELGFSKSITIINPQITKAPDESIGIINIETINIRDIVRTIINYDFYDVVNTSPIGNIQQNKALGFLTVSLRSDFSRSPFYSDYHKRHLITNTNYELFNGLGTVFNPFSLVWDRTPQTFSTTYFNSPNVGTTSWTLFYKYFTKSYYISKDRLHGRPYTHVDTQYSDHITWFSSHSSNAYGHDIPPNVKYISPHELLKCRYIVQRKHYHIDDLVEYQTVNGIAPGYVVEFENVEHNINQRSFELTKWEKLWHPEWLSSEINWSFEQTCGRLPDCLEFDRTSSYIQGNIQDYDTFLKRYQHEDWFKDGDYIIDDDYKDFDIAPITPDLYSKKVPTDPDNPRKHTVGFSGFLPRQNLKKEVVLSFFVMNNYSYDRDRLILNQKEKLFIDSIAVDPVEYLKIMKERGHFEYTPDLDDINIETNKEYIRKTLIHEIIKPEYMMVGCSMGNTPEEIETIKKLFYADVINFPKPAAQFRSCRPNTKERKIASSCKI